MAKISGNPAVKGARGMVNDTLVYRRGQDGLILCGAPEKSSKAPSVKQVEHREKFRLANFYAARVKANPELLALYEQAAAQRNYRSVHAFIVADYFSEPKVVDYIPDPGTVEKPGDGISVCVVDEMFARSVTLEIQAPDGTVLVSGAATMGADYQSWTLSLADKSVLASGNILLVEVKDYPGHVLNTSFVL